MLYIAKYALYYKCCIFYFFIFYQLRSTIAKSDASSDHGAPYLRVNSGLTGDCVDQSNSPGSQTRRHIPTAVNKTFTRVASVNLRLIINKESEGKGFKSMHSTTTTQMQCSYDDSRPSDLLPMTRNSWACVPLIYGMITREVYMSGVEKWLTLYASYPVLANESANYRAERS